MQLNDPNGGWVLRSRRKKRVSQQQQQQQLQQCEQPISPECRTICSESNANAQEAQMRAQEAVTKRRMTRSLASVRDRILSFERQLTNSDLSLSLQRVLSSVLPLLTLPEQNSNLSIVATTSNMAVRLVCLGLGLPSRCESSQWQLAYLRILEQCLRIKLGYSIAMVEFHEPLLTEVDKSILRLVIRNAHVPEVNLVGRIPVDGTLTVAYMPHCPSSLYCNLLSANWTAVALSRLVIVGNSFTSYATKAITAEQKFKLKLMKKVLPYCKEAALASVPVYPSYSCEMAIDDTTLIWFPKALLPEASNRSFWRLPRHVAQGQAMDADVILT